MNIPPIRPHLLFCALAGLCALPLSAVRINEVMSSNGGVVTDAAGNAFDWIELYNPGEDPVSLLNWGLSDDPRRPFQWIFPDVELGPRSYLLIWASGGEPGSGPGELHATFAIDRESASLALTPPGGGEPADAVTVPELPRNVSWGRQPDGGAAWRYFDEPTPGAANTGLGYETVLEPPQVSHPSGRYADAIAVTAGGEAGSVLRYMLDGSIPDETSPVFESDVRLADRNGDPHRHASIPTAMQESPFAPPEGAIRMAHTLRVRAFRENALPSRVVTATYFIGADYADPFALPVVSLVAAPDALFDPEIGIYAARIRDESGSNDAPDNFWNRGREWERDVHLGYFSETGARLLEQDAGVRIHGGLTRGYQVKSLRLYARRDYGERWFNHPFFGDAGMPRYRRLLLRTSGNDSDRGTLFRDAFMHRLVGHMHFDTQAYNPAIVFINGEYWGIHNFRERYDRHYLAHVYDVPEDQVDLLTANAEVKEGEGTEYRALLDLLESRSADDPHLPAEIEARMDIDNYLDYLIAQIFLNNTDWPHSNIDFWRASEIAPGDAYRAEHDGRWRWLLYDLDFGYNLWHESGSGTFSHTFNTLEHVTSPEMTTLANPPWSTFLIRSVLAVPEFRDRFLNRFADHLNSTFRTGRAIRIMDEMAGRIRAAIPEHTRRYPALLTEAQWERSIEFKRTFAQERPEIVWGHLVEHFDLEGTAQLEIHVSDRSGGTVRVNDLFLHQESPGLEGSDPLFPWTGRYFRGVPVRVEAVPTPGFRFDRWADTGGADPVRLLDLEGGRILAAVFLPETDEEPVAHPLAAEPYHFSEWSPAAPAGSAPPFMRFVESPWPDPDLRAPLTGTWAHPYNLESRSRVVGLGPQGVGFLNTSNPQPGEDSAYVAGALLALDTRGLADARLDWTGGTAAPTDRVYRWRLQYRTMGAGEFTEFLTESGDPVEVWSTDGPWSAVEWNGLALPEELLGRPHVELLWRYTAFDDGASGPRPKLFLGDIRVEGDPIEPSGSLPDGTFWSAFEQREDGRYGVPWWGEIHAQYFPWIFHELHGWQFAYDTGEDAPPWWWDPQIGYVWTAPDLYPFIYIVSAEHSGWGYYYWGTTNPRFVFSFTEQRWIPFD